MAGPSASRPGWSRRNGSVSAATLGDTAVEITLDDGTTQTYRGGDDLATAFCQVLPNYSA